MSDNEPVRPTARVMTIVEWLQDAGYRGTPTKGGTGVLSATSGMKFLVGTFDTSIQFFMGMTLQKDSITWADCNKYNKEWRFVKVYLDDDNDLGAEMDVILNTEDGGAQTVFLKALDFWDSSLGRLKQWAADHAKER